MGYNIKRNIYSMHSSQHRMLVDRKFKNFITCALLVLVTIVPLLSTGLILAQELPYPDPLLPKTGAEDVAITLIVFSWKPFYAGTEEYTFELSTKYDMSDDVFQAVTKNRVTTYTYRGKLEYDTTYWWRVMATKPLGGEWSPVSSFTTKTAAADSTNAASPGTSSDSASGSLIASLKDIGWPIIGGIAAGIIILIVVLVLLLRPPRRPANPGLRPGAPPFMPGQQSLTCRTCGFSNDPSRKFCNNCGSPLLIQGQQQTGGGQQPSPCPVCNFMNPPQQQFCVNCGNALTNMRQQTGPDQPNLCPACGLPNMSGQKFCSRCGGGLMGSQQKPWQIYQTFSCPFCGSTVNKQTNPCPNCGNWLNWN